MSELNSLEGFRDRFWYWRGQSGSRYIHSIYAPDNCPPLPGAIFVMVQKLASGKRAALEVGRFNENWDYVEGVIEDCRVGFSKVDEIHVHLLAQSNDNADEVVKDLVAGIGPRPVCSGSVARRPVSTGKIFGRFRETAPLAADEPVKTPKWQLSLFDDQAAESVLASV